MHHAWPMTLIASPWCCTSSSLCRPVASLLGARVKTSFVPATRRLPARSLLCGTAGDAKSSTSSTIERSIFSRSSIIRDSPLCWGNSHPYPPRRSFTSKPPLRRRQQLPRDYDPEEGVQFRPRDLDQFEIRAIFGPVIDKELGNQILKIQHGRRLAGTIFDEAFPPPGGFNKRVGDQALKWLRKNYPVNEDAAYQARMQADEARHTSEVVEDAERIGVWRPQQNMSGDKNYGKSVLDQMKEEGQREIEERRAQQAKEIEQNGGNSGTLRDASRGGEVAHREPPQWLEHYQKRAVISDATSPPEMSKVTIPLNGILGLSQVVDFQQSRRLLPSLFAVLLAIGTCFMFSAAYTPPPRSARLWPDTPPAAATVIGIILLNGLVLVAWRIPPFYRILNKYFISVPGYPFALSTLGNVFSHQQFQHYGMNMLVLWVVGTRLHDHLNRADFLTVYIVGGVVGSFFSLAGHTFRNNLVVSSLGASGAVCAVLGAWLWTNLDQYFRPIFLPSSSPDEASTTATIRSWTTLPASVLITLLVAVEVLGVTRRWGKVDHLAHLGGYIGGISSLIALRYGRRDGGGVGDGRDRRRNVLNDLTGYSTTKEGR